MLTILAILVIAAIVIAIMSAIKPGWPLWVAVLLLAIVEALHTLPGGFIR